MIAVETRNLSKQYKVNLAVDNISLQVPAGVKCGFLGKNGAGKTSTIKMLTGLKKPTSGSYSIMGEAQSFGKRNLAVGYLPDVPNFYGYMTAPEFLTLCAKLCNIEGAKRKERVNSLLKQVGLDGVRTRIATYSRGMKQRLGIAQAMINNPAVIFMDEPISALDPTGRRDVMEIVKALNDTTVVFSTHILSDVEDVCDYILIIEKGKILAQDTLANLITASAKNQVGITFYEGAHLTAFKQSLGQTGGLHIQTPDSLSLAVSSQTEDLAAISKTLTRTLGSLDLPCKSFAAHTPTLEEIFHDTLQKGGEQHA